MGNRMRYPRLTNVLVITAILISLAFFVPGALAQEITPELQLSPASGPPGTSVTVRASGFPADTNVQVGPGVSGAEPVSTRTIATDEDGDFTTTIAIPADADPNRAWIVLAFVPRPGGGDISTTAVFDVTTVPQTERTYTVRSGDTLSEIAAMFDTSVSALLRANQQIEDPSLIFPGQVLAIPGNLVVIPDTGQRVYVVESGDILSEIADRFGASVEALLEANPEIEDPSLIFPGQRIQLPVPVNVIPDTGQVVYVVQSGDTLSEIAVRFDTTVNALLEANPQIKDPTLIFPGQRFVIPSGATASG